MVLQLLILVALVLVLFEGRLIRTMVSQRSSSAAASGNAASTADQTGKADKNDNTASVQQENTSSDSSGNGGAVSSGQAGSTGLAGLSAVGGESSKNGSSGNASANTSSEGSSSGGSEAVDSPAVVPEQSDPVDDSYFTDAVFIGDSRMEGFRNASGITQGTFLTSVGMSLSEIGNTKVNTADGIITVYQGLSGRQYSKIYLMLGTNDLGFYPWEDFPPTALSVLNQIHELQPGAVIYVCSVIYVEGYKISTDYVNNENVMKVNGYLLDACEDLDYCWYLNLNEALGNGYHSLIDGASQDGVHLYEPYLKQMLLYMKNHYLPQTLQAETPSTESSAEEETE